METMRFLKSDYKIIDDGMYWNIIPVEKKQECIEVDFLAKTENLIQKFAISSKMDVADLRGPRRGKHEISLGRQCIIYFLLSVTPFSYKTVGSFFSNRDHSTVKYSKDEIVATLSLNIPHYDKPAIKKYLELLRMIWEN